MRYQVLTLICLGMILSLSAMNCEYITRFAESNVSMRLNNMIIEDEKPAADKLELLLHKYDDTIEIVQKIQSVENSIAFLKENEKLVDLIFMDIQLTDGISFDIFKSFSVSKPIIFISL